MAARSYGQYCGVTTAVELIGERWALLIVRDLLVGPRRYTDLKQGLPRIPTNILSTRLKELQEGGVVRRVPLLGCGLVYELTPYGRALEPIVLALGRWGFQAMGDPDEGDVVTPDSLTMALRTAFRPEAAERLDVELHVGDVALRAIVRDGALAVAQLAPPAPPVGGVLPAGEAEAVLVAGPGIRRLIGGEVTPAEAIAQDLVAVVRGEERILDVFARVFHIDPVAGLDAPGSARDASNAAMTG
ncbi:helix-turn-helix domain-containing protein [Microbacterium capsulatum]|uniref:Helix-turn-helix domain-containing protein n=1 Tax=Microbacterium capsulatum TaxID=3041921 RepID=A0ABU0XE90_9MICO|nr:helix-turn-helix domain-containing protein [Microbacterium sp. ASV81]MDQ4213432.1 helix-turn-helix domain-containing protein [Microbacterium sp. ASV81]